jgi:hypothetical protein
MLLNLALFIFPLGLIASGLFNIISRAELPRRGLLDAILKIEYKPIVGKPAIIIGWTKIVFGIFLFIGVTYYTIMNIPPS